MNAVIIGRNGQVAQELQQVAPENAKLLVLGSSDVDITNVDELQEKITAFSPDFIINASAYTAVDKAESDENQAYLINGLAVANLAKIAKLLNIRFLHISTDFVFDGKSNIAYKPDDLTNPQSVYGASKLSGEKVIAEIYPENSSIVRTSWVYSSHGNNFVKTMLRLMSEKDELGVVADQIGCPTYAKYLAKFLWKLAAQNNIDAIYHWSDLGVATWYDFAVAIQDVAVENGLLTKVIPINPISTTQFPTPAQRPSFSLMNVSGSQEILAAKHWRKNLVDMIKYLQG